MKTLRKCIYLILGFFLIGFASCANDSGNADDGSPAQLFDRNQKTYRDGFYEYDDGYTKMYLYYEYQNLVSAGNAQNEYEDSRIKVLKQSHSWKNVHQYCSRYEVSLSDGWMCNVGKIPLKFFKKGWWSFEKTAYLGGSIIVYYESHNEYPAYQVLKKGDTFYRAPPTYYSYWISSVSLKDSNPAFISEELDYYPELSSMFKKGWWKITNWSADYFYYFENLTDAPVWQAYAVGKSANLYRFANDSYFSDNWIIAVRDKDAVFINEDLDYYPELSSMFKKGWWKITSWASDYFCYFENLTDAPSWKAHAMGDSDKIYRFANENDYSDNWIITFRKESVAFISEDLNHYPEKTGISE